MQGEHTKEIVNTVQGRVFFVHFQKKRKIEKKNGQTGQSGKWWNPETQKDTHTQRRLRQAKAQRSRARLSAQGTELAV